MSSCRKGADEGWFIHVEGGEIVDEGPAAIPVGTRLALKYGTFSSMFRARLEIFKQPRPPKRDVAIRCFFKIALANVDAGFTFTSNGREAVPASGRAIPAGTVVRILAAQYLRIPCWNFPHEAGEMKVHGCAGIPGLAQGRGDRIGHVRQRSSGAG